MTSRRFQLVIKNSLFSSYAIRYDFQAHSILGKEQLEELKRIKKVKEPLLTQEERASKVNKQEIKGTGTSYSVICLGFNLQMVCSEKGRAMIEA